MIQHLNKPKAVIEANMSYDTRDMLTMTYNTSPNYPLIGAHYSAAEANRDPDENMAHLRLLFQWYREKFPQDRFILLGHSQGGFMAYRLALEFIDSIAGVVTFDSPLKGADIIPSDVDKLVAPLFGGTAADYYINRAAQQDADEEVESNVYALRDNGVAFYTFSSLSDRVVASQYSYVRNAIHAIGGVPLKDRFDMFTSDIWPVREDESKPQVDDNWIGHFAVTNNPDVLAQLPNIVGEAPVFHLYPSGKVKNF